MLEHVLGVLGGSPRVWPLHFSPGGQCRGFLHQTSCCIIAGFCLCVLATWAGDVCPFLVLSPQMSTPQDGLQCGRLVQLRESGQRETTLNISMC